MNDKNLYSLLGLILATLACRPIIAVSWNEFLIVSGLFAVLLGPPIYRWIQRVKQFFEHKKSNK